LIDLDQVRKNKRFESYLQRQTPLILDGGMATELERRGANLQHALWSARMLLENPDLVREVHLDFLRAGADIITSASYQASLAGFQRAGQSGKDAIRLMRNSVELAIEARSDFLEEPLSHGRLEPLVAASIGPYGACLMDGSEYTGDYDLSSAALMEFHRPRMELLADSEADLLAIETIPSRHEFETLMRLLEEFPDKDAWFSFSCRDATHLSHGETLAECASLADGHPQVVAVGVNCTDPKFVPELLASVGAVSTPLLAYPNSGETWDPATGDWMGEGAAALDAAAWVQAGAKLVGGCCRVYPEQISLMRRSLLDGGS
jgi:homocysteine S-methyltransferase